MLNKILKTLSIFVLLLFSFSTNSYADFGDSIILDSSASSGYEYTIIEYKREKNPAYKWQENIGNDIVCTSGIIPDVDACNVFADKDIKVYYAWKLLEKVEPYVGSTGYNVPTFSKNVYMFTEKRAGGGKFEWYKSDESLLTGANVGKTLTTSSFTKQSARRIDYIMLYLHRTNSSIELFENTRIKNYYASGTVKDFLPSSLNSGSTYDKARYALVLNNGKFTAPATSMAYSPVPHVLGYEGSSDMYVANISGSNSQKGVVSAVMEEKTGMPVPVFLTKGNTGFFKLKESSDKTISVIKNEYAPGYSGNLETYNLANLRTPDYFKGKTNKEGEAIYGSFKATDAANKNYQIDEVMELRKLINSMGGPQYVGSIDIAMSEAITQRNSTYQFMSSMPMNGNYIFTTVANNGYNGSPESSYGVMNLKPRNLPIYMYGGDTAKQAKMIKLTQTNDASNSFADDRVGSGQYNSNFKIGSLGIIRAFFTSSNYSQIYNYHNEVVPYVIETVGPTGVKKQFFGFKLVPKTPTTTSNGASTINTGLNQTTTWGIWRQLGWTSSNEEIGSYFPLDTVNLPNNTVLNDWSGLNPGKCHSGTPGSLNCDQDVLRFPWVEHANSPYQADGKANVSFLNSYINKFKFNDSSDKNYDYYSMYNSFTHYLRSRPELIYKLFYMGQDMNNMSALESTERPRNNNTSGTDANLDTSKFVSLQSLESDRLDKIAQKLCENFTGKTCAKSISSLTNAIFDPEMSDFPTSYLAMADAFSFKDGNTTYGEDLSYIMFNYFAKNSFADEFNMGNFFYIRRPNDSSSNAYYAYTNLLSIDSSNVFILNEETRLGNPIIGTKGEDDKSIGTTVKVLNKDADGNLVTEIVGEKKGTELYLINPTTGERYSATSSGSELTCPESYTREGDFCKKTEYVKVNSTCSNGFVFDWTQMKCIQEQIGTPTCPDGYELVLDKCERYVGTDTICEIGTWDAAKKMCLETTAVVCPSGYTLINNKCVAQSNPTCPSGFIISGDRCAGYLSGLTSYPSSYTIDCAHVVLASGEKVTLSTFKVGDMIEIPSTESGKVFTAPVSGDYYFEAWGASNGASKGGYTSGIKTLAIGESVNVSVGIQNANTETKFTSEVGGLILNALSGTGSANGTSATNRLVKTPTQWFKQPTDSGTIWIGEQGHLGNGLARITLYSAHGQSVTPLQKTKAINFSGSINYSYTGTYTSFTAPATGSYKLEAWGAEGGTSSRSWDSQYNTTDSANGGYNGGNITLTEGQTVYVYVGSSPLSSPTGGWNGGGNGVINYNPSNFWTSYAGGGGGATDFRTTPGNWNDLNSLNSRILVAGGGGGSAAPSNYYEYYSSGSYKYPDTNANTYHTGKFGALSSFSNKGMPWVYDSSYYPGTPGTDGTLGIGGNGGGNIYVNYGGTLYGSQGSGGGGGYYGGGGGAGGPIRTSTLNYGFGGDGGGGSLYFAPGFTNKVTITGNNDGHGKAAVSYNFDVNEVLGYQLTAPNAPKNIGFCLTTKTAVNVDGTGFRANLATTKIADKNAVITAGNGTPLNYAFTGNYTTYTVPTTGNYKLEVWGAQGGGVYGGKGGYSTGITYLTAGQTVYVYVGGQGASSSTWSAGGFNGGGQGGYGTATPGGGATDIRVGTPGIGNRVIVAGGGGGGYSSSWYGGAGGGLVGLKGAINEASFGGTGGTQTTGGVSVMYPSISWTYGSLGQGGAAYTSADAGGGGGYYGGASGYLGGGGGSSYIGGVINGQTIAGNGELMTSPSGGTVIGNTGNGYARITPASSVQIKGEEAKIKTIPVCASGLTFDISTGKCLSEQATSCPTGYTFNATTISCERLVKPTSCSNGGELYYDAPGWACRLVEGITCEFGYTELNGTCIRNTSTSYTPQLCSNGFTIDGDKCKKDFLVPIADLNVDALDANQLVVEMGKLYMSRNYIGYQVSKERGTLLDFVVSGTNNGEKYSYVKSARFPYIEMNLTLVDKAIASTSLCATGTGQYCDKIPTDIKKFEIKMDGLGNEIKLLYGNKSSTGKFSSSEPACDIFVNTKSGLSVSACDSLWSELNTADDNLLINSDFDEMYSVVDSYFMFKDDEFCYANALPGTKVTQASLKCIPYESNPDFTIVENGVTKLDLLDTAGNEKINSLFIGSSISNYSKSSGYGLGLNVDNAYKNVDNNIFSDDNASLITGFKMAPDSDIFIDRFELYDASNNEIVFAADAMTLERCLNGYEIEEGITALYTQTFEDTAYDGGVDRGASKIDCTKYDPDTSVIGLDPLKNYYSKVYTKYRSIDETAINLGTPADFKEIFLDLSHTGNFGALGTYNFISSSLKTASVNAYYQISSGNFPNVGASVFAGDINHDSIVPFDITKGIITAKTATLNRYKVDLATLTSINTHFKPSNNYNLTVGDPRNSLIIPAEGLAAKGFTTGLLNVSIGGETLLRDAYPTWNMFPFSYSLGEGIDITSYPIMRCGTTELSVKDGTCVYIDANVYSSCALYAVVEMLQGTAPISANVRVDWNNSAKDILNANSAALYSTTTKVSPTNPKAYVFVANIPASSKAVYAETLHNSVDNGNYVDINWGNNTNDNCWLFNPVDYSVTDINITENEMIKPNLDGNGAPIKNVKTVTIKGTFDITKVYDYGTNKNIPIVYKLVENYNPTTGTYSNSHTCSAPTPINRVGTMLNGTKLEDIPFSINCNVNFGTLNPGNNLALVVGINGGFTGTRSFAESEYTNNETAATIFTRDVPTEFKCILGQCVTENRWIVNFDFVYQFDRNVVMYQSNTSAYTDWTDYKVGTISGSTQDRTYSSPGGGNIDRAPDDYMAYRSHTSTQNDLCTDYRSGINECWRYEKNVNHNVDYYRYSRAVTSVYATHQVLGSPSGTCGATTVSNFGPNGAGTSGSSYTYSNSTTTSGQNGGCTGYTTAPQKIACTQITSWFGTALCRSTSQVYSSTTTGSLPSNYIPAIDFRDKTLLDASAFAGSTLSPTTKTDKIVLKTQIPYTNSDQGANHPGWVQTRTADVCQIETYQNVSFHCPSGYYYGTQGGSRTTSAKSAGASSCPAAGYGTSSRTCSWNSTSAPTSSVYWPAAVGSTCYRPHYDWACGSYAGVSPVSSSYTESTSSQLCNYSTTSSSFYTRGNSSCTYSQYEQNASVCGSTCPTALTCPVALRCPVALVAGRCPQALTCPTALTCPVARVANYCYVSKTGSYNYTSCTGVWSGGDSTACSANPPNLSAPTCTTSNTVNRTKSCTGGDITEAGDLCYSVAGETVQTSGQVCAQWMKFNYQEITYYTTATPVLQYTSRSYQDAAKIWQYTCNTTTPTVAYPNNNSFKMNYREEVTMATEIKTERSGTWIPLQITENSKDANPRGGEWFEIRSTVTYSTTRAVKPNQMPYLTDYYNNYHNINGTNPFAAPQNNTTYPAANYPHYGKSSSVNVTTAFSGGPYQSVIATSGRDIVNNEDYGYCDVKPSEPYGCDYTGWQFSQSKQNNANVTQGHSGATWISNQGGNGICYFGPDNKTVWKDDTFGTPYDYEVIVEICPADVPDCDKTTALITSRMQATTNSCSSFINGLCTSYKTLWVPATQRDANGVYRNGFYIPTDFETKQAKIEISTSWFNAVGQYEKTLIGAPNATYGTEKFFIEQVGNPIKPLCSCNSYEIILKDGEIGWATSEWGVE